MNMWQAVLVGEWCIVCCETTDHELNTVALTVECQHCGRTTEVTATYAMNMLLED